MKKNKICIYSLTYNRPEYIERSFKSLYKRAGLNFDHFVFDDCSDKKTQELLKKLEKKYNFNLYINKERMGIYRNFYWNLIHIPTNYDYYVKLDSDIEILSDNFFSEIIEIFKLPGNISGMIPRIEGMRNKDIYDSYSEFYGGHTIKNEASIIYGCCLILTNNVFTSFKKLTKKEIKKTNKKWGIDSLLYEHSKKIGKFLIIEDLSVYHIDNMYGQRKRNDFYFTDRKRWDIIDNDEVWYMKESKNIYPKYIKRKNFERIRKISSNFKEFSNSCKVFLKDNIIVETNNNKIKNNIKIMYKITSPMNFKPDSNIQHGSFKLFSIIPEWAKNNPKVVIEIIETKVEEKSSNLSTREEQDEKKSSTKITRVCKVCKYTTSNLKRFKTHRKKHN